MAAFTDAVHSTKRFKLGTTRIVNGNEFIYLQGVAATVVGSWVTFTSAGVTTLLVAAGKGRVGIAMAATVASTFGWYQIRGLASGLTLGVTSGNKVWATATAGSVDDVDVATDHIAGAIFRSTTATGLVAVIDLSYPFAHAEVLN